MNERRKEHDGDALLLLDYFMQLPQDAPDKCWPSTAELQEIKTFGLRPVNRIGDLKKGKFNGHSYDFEMIPCGHGVNRWRLYWPNRLGHPKPKNQNILPLNPTSKFSAGKPSKSWEQVVAERDEKIRQPKPSFELTP